MENNELILRGEFVQLVAVEKERDSKLFTQWRRNSEYIRLLNGDPAILFSAKSTEKWIEKEDLAAEVVSFAIQNLQDGIIIGEIALDDILPSSTNVFVGIAIGEADLWGKGYGTDAMRIILRYAFGVLNVHRVSLTVFGYNQRAIRSYEKVGFHHEGQLTDWLNRDGKRWDLHFMGILKTEWEQRIKGEQGGSSLIPQ